MTYLHGHTAHPVYQYLYRQWRHMIERAKRRKAKGEVCEILFEDYLDFFNWAIENGWEKGLAVCRNGDVGDYSRENCRIDTVGANSVEAHSMNWRVVNPQGELINVYNLTKFCVDNNLAQSKMWMVVHGLRPHHKGWTKG